ncbi:hypothetical protein JG687_00007045 [Phytophthora cactorum]|uniref:ABC transporter domain-containing protein n=1 Tax=Phytophthora cactorum TaxID=29920 RepID=A0A8T1UL79_9STRA|nr:hypothetical protein JG687_00007045 [Phytophthora cactorum]
MDSDTGVVKPTGITVHVDPPTTKNNYSNSAGKPLRVTTHPFTLSWSNLSYTVNIKKKTPKHPDGKKAILTNVTGRCAPGELTAVMGPSGSGKTTLLDILADRISSGVISGDIFLNGETRNLKTFRAVSSYVAQEDSLLGSFTVRETLEMAAKLSLPSSITHHEIVERVQTVIDEMGLRVCEHTLVGDVFRKGISGGQKRRLSIAIELLSEPSILLLDEPTSGLDSASTYNVMKFVSRLCKENITVICTIHQPSSLVYDMFSNVVILTAGETVYFGPRLNMMSHFASLGYVCPEHEDPAEHYISIANTDFVGHGDIPSLVSGYAASPIAGKIQDAINADSTSLHGARAIERAPNSPLRQLVVLLKRNLIDNLRNPGIFWVRLVMYTVLSFMMGTMFLSSNKRIIPQDVVYLLTYANCFLVFMSIAVLPFFIEQRAVFLRERANSNLNVFSYVIANFLGALPGIFLIALSSTLLVGYLAGLNSYGIFLLIVFLSLVVAESLMHLVAACVSQFIIGMAIGAALFGWFILCMGLFVPRPAIPDYWIWGHYLGFLSYGFEALMHNQFHNETSPEAQFILARFGMEDADLGRDLAIVAANAVAFEILFTFVLYKFHTGHKEDITQLELDYAQQVRKVLYITEFMLLINYVEVIVPVIFSANLLVMYYLPNRVYYSQIDSMDDAKLWSTLGNLHISAVRQLAFVLEKQGEQVQTKLVFWVFYNVQATLQHFEAKTYFAFLLPIIKMILRNVMSRTVVHLNDEIPEVVLMNVEVFNSLFMSYCMQNTPSIWTTLGLIAIDGAQMIASMHDVGNVIKRMESEDSLLGSFTVQETLEMAARLTMPSTTTAITIVKRVQSVIDDMGLRVCENTMVGDMFHKGISGGQKRRLSIAIEMLSDPSILLLDEPTSGLDSASTYNVVKLISRLSTEGRTVVCTIHQPSSLVYEIFTNVVILTAGQTVYFGPRTKILSHFSSLGYNCPQYQDPVEYFIDLANTDFEGHGDIDQLINGYTTSAVAVRILSAIRTDAAGIHATRSKMGTQSSAFQQFSVLLHRNLLNNLRNPGIYWVRLVTYTALSTMVGTMYLSSNPKIVASDIALLLTYVIIYLVFLSIAVLPFFIEQRAVFVRERNNSGLNVFSYVAANFLGALPGIFLIALSSTLLVGCLAGLNSYGVFLVVVFLSLVVAENLMHLISAIVPQFIVGMALGAAVFGWFILVMGLFVPGPAMPNYWRWAHRLGFLSYSFEALLFNQFRDDLSLQSQTVLAKFVPDEVDIGKDMAVLAANAVAFEMAFAVILYKFHTGRR